MGHGETTYFLESWGLPQNSTQRSGGDKKEFQIPHLRLNDSYLTISLQYALKSIPGLADVGVPHEDGDGPRTQPR